jgi:hypothetical protein
MKRLCLAGALTCLGLAPAAQAALQVALGKANTSVGLLPTSTANKWKLQTDPAIVQNTVSGPDLSTYIPISGSLSNSYDPTKFTLAVNPLTMTYGLGDSVIGLGAYEVTSFDVQTKNGGLIDVKPNPADPNTDLITDITTAGPVGGGESGNVLNVQFQLIPDRRALALPATVDQFFYELHLVQIGTGSNFNPGIGTAFPDGSSFLTDAPADPTNPSPAITTPNTGINSSTSVPEPAMVGLFAITAGTLLARRRLSGTAKT